MALGCVHDTQYSCAVAVPSPTITAPRRTPATISGLPLGLGAMSVRLFTSPRESPENAAFPGCGGNKFIAEPNSRARRWRGAGAGRRRDAAILAIGKLQAAWTGSLAHGHGRGRDIAQRACQHRV